MIGIPEEARSDLITKIIDDVMRAAIEYGADKDRAMLEVLETLILMSDLSTFRNYKLGDRTHAKE